MKELSINRKNALAAYSNADSNGKELLEHLLGKEIFNAKITDRINTLEDAYEETGRPQCPDFDNVPEDWREYFKSQYDALVVAEALNEGWDADYKDGSQQKHYPYFHSLSSSGFAFNDTNYEYSNPNAGNAARQCLKYKKANNLASWRKITRSNGVGRLAPKTPIRKAKKLSTNKQKKMSLGYPQRIALSQFKDCLEKTKKSGRFNDSATLISGLLDNSSIVQHGSDRSFSLACTAIDALNKFLCPGVWCNRSHCKEYNSSSAYNCRKTRPAVCKDYAEYRKKQIRKKVGGKFYENEEAEKQISWLFDDTADLFDKSKKYRFQNIIKENICAGIYYDESTKKYISFYWEEDRFLITENKKEVDAIESLFSKQKYTDRELIQRVYKQVKEDKL